MSELIIPNPASADLLTILRSSNVAAVNQLTLGATAFIGEEPAKPDNCVTLFDTPGYPPDRHYDPTIKYYRPAVQVRVRNTAYLSAYNLISAIRAVLHNNVFTVGQTQYTAIFCTIEPAPLDWDANGRSRWVTTFDIQRCPVDGVQW